MTASIAALTECEGAARTLCAARPIADSTTRRRENRRLAEAIRRQGEPGDWCRVGLLPLAPMLIAEEIGEGAEARLDGPGLVEVLGWLEAAATTREVWTEPGPRERYPELAALVEGLPDLEGLRKKLAQSLEPDGRVSDAASPKLQRARAGLATGERDLQGKLERWVKPFGETSYVTRRGDRFVALVPAAGFSRRRGLVHDVSGSGQSLFVEPFEACEANNRLIELRAGVADEERRVLRELADLARGSADALTRLEEILVSLDSLRARARWAKAHGGIALDPGGDRLRLRGARHPLLATGARRDDVVPLDLELEPERRILLVSGPNMGGKTVLLKTVGLAAAASHAALPVLAQEGSAVPELDAVIVDLGDEQSLDQGLSTFAAHLRSLAEMANQAGPRTLVLGDEMGAGTDPEEGAALGRALLERFAERDAWAVVTTHLGSLKRAAAAMEGVLNGSLEFDSDRLVPRFRFLPGVPGASHALSMAERLGFDPEIVARARAMTPEESRQLERLLLELQDLRREMEDRAAALEREKAEAEHAAAENREARDEARRGVADLRRRLTRESEVVLGQVRELWQSVQREARRAEKSREGATRLREELQAAEGALQALGDRAEEARRSFGGDAEPAAERAPALVPGALVRALDFGFDAEVVAGPDADGKVTLRRGSFRIESHVSRLAAPAERGDGARGSGGGSTPRDREARAGAAARWEIPDEAPALEVDVRGKEVDEALRALDNGLDRGVVSGLSELRIVHGIGRGILRAAVERHLRSHPQVISQRLGELGEGGRGVTVAKLR